MGKTMVKNPNKKIQSQNDSPEFSSFEDGIVAVSDIPVNLKFVIYGRSGSGKTTFLKSLPRPLLIIDPREKGTASIRSQDDIFARTIRNWDEFEEGYWYLLNKGKGRYKSIAIDTLTSLQDMAVRKVKGETNAGPMSQRAWGEVGNLMRTWLLLFGELGFVTAFTAQDRIYNSNDEDGEADTDDDEDGTILPEVGPYLMPSVAKIVCASVDIIGHTFIKEKDVEVKGKPKRKIKYCMRVGPHAKYLTKIRTDSSLKAEIPRVIENPTYDKLLKLSLGEDLD